MNINLNTNVYVSAADNTKTDGNVNATLIVCEKMEMTR